MDFKQFGNGILQSIGSKNLEDNRETPSWHQQKLNLIAPWMGGEEPASIHNYQNILPQMQQPVLLGPPDNMQSILDSAREPQENARVNQAFKNSLLRLDPQQEEYERQFVEGRDFINAMREQGRAK